MDVFVLLSSSYSFLGPVWQKLDIHMTTYFSFDEVSLKNEVKLIVIIFVCVCVCVCHSFKSKRDVFSFRFLECVLFTVEFSRFSYDSHVKNPKIFRIKIRFNIYCVLIVDKAFVKANACQYNHNTAF